MKRNNKLLLSISISLLCLSACSKPVKEEGTPVEEPPTLVRIHTSLITSNDSAYFPYVFDINDFINITDEPNKNVLTMSVLFSANIASSAYVSFEKTDFPIDSLNDHASFYKHLDIKDLEEFDVVSKDGFDVYDVDYMCLAHKQVTTDEKNYDVCFVTIEDTSYSSVAWISNFDVGYDDDSYYSKTGEHPQWTDKENHKGFDVTANRCLSIVEDYKNRKLDENSQQIFYIFGHSRGGAVANLLATKMIDADYLTVSYSLASPGTTTSENAHLDKYKHVYSYICVEDVIVNILPEDWGFTRYGKTYSFSLKENSSKYEEINGYPFTADNNKMVISWFKKLLDSRDDFYRNDEQFLIASSENLETEEVDDFAQTYLNILKEPFENLKNYVQIETTQVEENTQVKVLACPGFYSIMVGTLMGELDFDSSTLNRLKTLSPYIDCFSRITGFKSTDILLLNVNGFIHCHYYQAYLTYINL